MLDDLVDVTRRVVKLEDRLSQIQVTLDAHTETFNLVWAPNYILPPLDDVATAQTRLADRLTRLEAVSAHPIPKARTKRAVQTSVSVHPRPFTASSVASPVLYSYNLQDPHVNLHLLGLVLLSRILMARMMDPFQVINPWRRTSTNYVR